MNRLLDDPARRDIYGCPILHQGRVEGDKGMVPVTGVTGQVRFDPFGALVQSGCQPTHLHVLGNTPERRKFCRVVAVYKHRLAGLQQPEAGAPNSIRRQPLDVISSTLERNRCDRLDAGVPPLLIAIRGKAQFGKTGYRRLADFMDPRLAVTGQLPLQPGVIRPVKVFRFRAIHDRGEHTSISSPVDFSEPALQSRNSPSPRASGPIAGRPI